MDKKDNLHTRVDSMEQDVLDSMHHINVIRESQGLPIFKTLEAYRKWHDSEIQYDN